MIHQFKHSFDKRFSTSVTTQSVLLPNDVESVESLSMLDITTGEIFDIEEYSKAFNNSYVAAYPLYGSYQFTKERFFFGEEKRVHIRFHNPNQNYTHLLITFKSKIIDRQIKCDILLAS